MANPLGLKPQPIVFPESLEKTYRGLPGGLGEQIRGIAIHAYEAGFDEACITIHETAQFLSKTGQA